MCSWSRLGVGRVMRGKREPHHREGREVVFHRGRAESDSEPLVRFGPHIVGRSDQSHEHCLTNGHRPLRAVAAQWVSGGRSTASPGAEGPPQVRSRRPVAAETTAQAQTPPPTPAAPGPIAHRASPAPPPDACVAAPWPPPWPGWSQQKSPLGGGGRSLPVPPGATAGIRRQQLQSFFLDLAATAGSDTPPLTLTSVILPPMR